MNDETIVDIEKSRKVIEQCEDIFVDQRLTMAEMTYITGSLIGRIEDCETMQHTALTAVQIATDIHNLMYHADDVAKPTIN